MLRLSKLTDYAIVLLSYLTRSSRPKNARELAELSGLPHPTVSKVLKMLARAELLISVRGQRGGYQLAAEPNTISVTRMISAIEGPLALTECSADAPGHTVTTYQEFCRSLSLAEGFNMLYSSMTKPNPVIG